MYGYSVSFQLPKLSYTCNSTNTANPFLPGSKDQYLSENVVNKSLKKPMQLPFKGSLLSGVVV